MVVDIVMSKIKWIAICQSEYSSIGIWDVLATPRCGSNGTLTPNVLKK